jgi:DNA modification methylase
MSRTIIGNCLEVLPTLDAGSIHTVVTSPPYFGLRDYGHADQIGLEASPEDYIARLVEVFREVKRVLRDDGTLWLNLGDSYNSIITLANNRKWREGSARADGDIRTDGQSRRNRDGIHAPGLKAKDWIGIPWRVALALQSDGANSREHMLQMDRMIAAITDSYDSRDEWPDRISEQVEQFELERIDANQGGWYLRQDIIWSKPNAMPESVTERCTKAHEYLFLLSKAPRYYFDSAAMQEPSSHPHGPGNVVPAQSIPGERHGENANIRGSLHLTGARETRNRRSVWTVPTSPYSGAHFATFPPDLIRPCILAGSPPGGFVLDPFGGSGTTGQVATEEGREAVLIELNPEYAKLIAKRAGQTNHGLGIL